MNNQTITLHTAGLIVVKTGKLLLAYSRNKQAWYLPGGKVDAGETALQAVIREIKEELNLDLIPEGLQSYCHVSAPAYGEEAHILMEQDCFLYELNADIQPSNEIDEVAYFDLQTYKQQTAQVSGVLKVFEILEADGLLTN